MFYAFLYFIHPLPSMQNFTEIVPGDEPLRRLLNATYRVAKYSDFGLVEGYISETVRDRAMGKIYD